MLVKKTKYIKIKYFYIFFCLNNRCFHEHVLVGHYDPPWPTGKTKITSKHLQNFCSSPGPL